MVVSENAYYDASHLRIEAELVDDLFGTLAITLGGDTAVVDTAASAEVNAQEYDGLQDLLGDLGWSETEGIPLCSGVSMLLLGLRVCAHTRQFHHAL
jgi:hypothetical protein